MYSTKRFFESVIFLNFPSRKISLQSQRLAARVQSSSIYSDAWNRERRGALRFVFINNYSIFSSRRLFFGNKFSEDYLERTFTRKFELSCLRACYSNISGNSYPSEVYNCHVSNSFVEIVNEICSAIIGFKEFHWWNIQLIPNGTFYAISSLGQFINWLRQSLDFQSSPIINGLPSKSTLRTLFNRSALYAN